MAYIHLAEIFFTFKKRFKMKCVIDNDMPTALGILLNAYLALLSMSFLILRHYSYLLQLQAILMLQHFNRLKRPSYSAVVKPETRKQTIVHTLYCKNKTEEKLSFTNFNELTARLVTLSDFIFSLYVYGFDLQIKDESSIKR